MRTLLARGIVCAGLALSCGCGPSEQEVADLRIQMRQLEERLDRIEAAPRSSSSTDATAPVASAAPENFDQVHPQQVGSSPIRGNPNAPITLVVYSDFQCAFCARASPLLQSLLKKYPDDVRIVFKHHAPKSQHGSRALALASLAAQEQGRFWEFHDVVFAHQGEADASVATLRAYAAEAELDVKRFQHDFRQRRTEYERRIDEDMRQASSADVREPPTLFINGRKVENRSVTGMSAMIEQALQATSEFF